MQYTLWSHGRLLGETDLGYARCLTKHRMGWFHPNDLGERLIPLACGVPPALRELVKLSRRVAPNPHATNSRGCDVETMLKASTEFADVAAAEAHREGLALELRGPTGAVIPTEWIGVQDTEYLASIEFDESISLYEVEVGPMPGEPTDEEIEAEVQAMLDEMGEPEPWQGHAADEEPSDFPRYQIQVRLFDEADVP